MFSRRKNRPGLATAYTGVNHPAPAANQPNSNAMAAAVTIGQALKAGQSTQQPAFQPQQPQNRGSLLKRSTSIGSGVNRAKTTRSGPISRTSSVTSAPARPRTPQRAQNADSSFDDHHSNHAQMRDLKLHPIPPSLPLTGPKMVKKYIPTPTGIKVVEVPEASLQQEISRSNSMRSGHNIARTGSLTKPKVVRSLSLTAVLKQTHKPPQKPSLRLSSLSSAPKIFEEVELEESLGHDDAYASLQKQIDHEKRLAEDFAAKKLEYEQLKLQRLKNERALLQLQEEADQEHASQQAAYQAAAKHSAAIQEAEKTRIATLEAARALSSEGAFGAATHQKQVQQTLAEQKANRTALAAGAATAASHLADDTSGETYISKPQLHNVFVSSEEDSVDIETPDAAIHPASVVVDELEKKELENIDGVDAKAVVVDELDRPSSLDELGPSGTAIGIITQYGNFASTELLESPTKAPLGTELNNHDPQSLAEQPEIDTVDDFGIEEVAYDGDEDDKSALARHLRPKFDAIPEIIDADFDLKSPLSDDTLRIPVYDTGAASGASSISSVDSATGVRHKRPVKLAMKNSNSFYNSSNSLAANSNAARDAYLSLTTAENTRLNSKLSASNLQELPTAQPANGSANKRLSQSLRKAPPQPAGTLASRSLRPQSYVEPPRAQNGNGFALRSLRDRNSAHIQGIPPHPALSPNYQSPSKARAAELYARASARPNSVFNLDRKSSFDKSLDPRQQNARQPTLPAHRTTLRGAPPSPNVPVQRQPQPVPEYQPQVPQQAQTVPPQRHFQSRLADSDDEDSVPARGYSSRFNDSDSDEPVSRFKAAPVSHLAAPPVPAVPSGAVPSTKYVTSLREAHKEPVRDEKTKKGEKKPKKKNILRKIFGRD